MLIIVETTNTSLRIERQGHYQWYCKKNGIEFAEPVIEAVRLKNKRFLLIFF